MPPEPLSLPHEWTKNVIAGGYVCGHCRLFESAMFDDECELRTLRAQVERFKDSELLHKSKLNELHEHLALMVRYLEEESNSCDGNGVSDEHWDGYRAAKVLLSDTTPESAKWIESAIEISDLRAQVEIARRAAEHLTPSGVYNASKALALDSALRELAAALGVK